MHPTKQTYAAPKLSVLTGPTIQESDKTQVGERIKELRFAWAQRGLASVTPCDEVLQQGVDDTITRAIAHEAALNSKTARDFASVDSICQRILR